MKAIDDFLLGIAEATNALISRSLEDGIHLALETLCKNLSVTSAMVYVNRIENGKIYGSLKYLSSRENNPERFEHNQNLDLSRFGDLIEVLSGGESFQVVYSQSEGSLHDHMKIDGTKSVTLFPIQVQGELWGILGLSDMEKERPWSVSENSLLMSLANSIGAAIEREQLENNLEELVEARTEELKDNKLRFQLAIEGTQNGIWDWEPLEHKIFWSDNMYKNLGYQREDLTDLIEGFYDLVHPDDKEEARRRMDNYLEHQVPYKMEFRLRRKNGSYHWFKSTCKAVWNKEGQAIRVVGCHEDIHARKVYNELLAQQEERFKMVILNDPNPLFLVNQSGRIVLQSVKAEEVFGYSAEEFKSMKVTALLPQDKREDHFKELSFFFQNPHVYKMGQGIEIKARKKNGAMFSVEVQLSPVSFNGETQVMAIVNDVSEKRRAEARLEESYRQINNLINNMPGIVYHCRNDKRWTMDFISPACEEITGYKPEEFYGVPSDINYADLIMPEDRDEVWEHVQESISRKTAFRTTYRIRDRAGKRKWIWEQGVGVFDKEGDVIGLEGCIFDITPIIRNQERINHAIYVTENKERRRIAADLHDGVQQVLGVSSINLKSLEKEVSQMSSDAQGRYLKSLEFLDKGIKESRNIAHRLMPGEIDQMGLCKAIENLLVEFENSMGVEIKYYYNLTERPAPEIELGLYRVVQESLNNIRKYAKAQKISVQLMASDDEIQMLIEDDGVGFDKNKIDLYKQGFGLTGMKSRIAGLSGQLSIDTRPGRGTCIVVWLPKRKKSHE
ncbi:PAS domain-containing protein [Roseivirga sp.]|uniref:PAS domain-containing protein n=1 Tax=Roseivirga sp. TaxID=1964215 RepID=UPI003B51F25E